MTYVLAGRHWAAFGDGIGRRLRSEVAEPGRAAVAVAESVVVGGAETAFVAERGRPSAAVGRVAVAVVGLLAASAAASAAGSTSGSDPESTPHSACPGPTGPTSGAFGPGSGPRC